MRKVLVPDKNGKCHNDGGEWSAAKHVSDRKSLIIQRQQEEKKRHFDYGTRTM
jgi:hypothetical protein